MTDGSSGENPVNIGNCVASYTHAGTTNSNNDKPSNATNFHSLDDKVLFVNKLKEILSCGVCLELKRSAILQCKYGHLICAGCFGDMIAESKLQNEITSCPTCNITISKDLCSRNTAVENTICELPVACPYCGLEYPLNVYHHHKTQLCMKRPTICENYKIGCLWKGPFMFKYIHEEKCKQPYLNGYNILKSLDVFDEQQKEGVNFYDKILELLSSEKIACADIQFKPCGDDSKNLLFETSKFSAFDLQWLVRGCYPKDPGEPPSLQLNYQLISKSKLINEMNLHFIILRGPYIEMEISPKLYSFKFCEKTTESAYQDLTLLNPTDLSKFLSAKRINLRIFMFWVR